MSETEAIRIIGVWDEYYLSLSDDERVRFDALSDAEQLKELMAVLEAIQGN